MTNRAAACPACSARTFRLLGNKNGFEMRSCISCGTLAAAGEFSTTESLYEEIYAKPPNLTSGAQAGLRRILDDLNSSRLSGRMLDYGFGAGDLMREARERGWMVSGIEYSDNVREHAQAEGFDVAKDSECLAHTGYDVVTMIEVIEHLPDAYAALRNAFSLLRPGGRLYVTTPNSLGLNPRFLGLKWSVAAPPDHRVLFSSAGLISLARRSGFLATSLRTEGFNPNEWRSLGKECSRTTLPPAPAATLNDRVEASASLRLVKRAVNVFLSASGLGDTIKMTAQRP